MESEPTRGAEHISRPVSRGARRLALALLLAPVIAVAQAPVRSSEVQVGSTEERYLRTLSLLSDAPVTNWLVRPVPAASVLKALATTRGPWALDTTNLRRGFTGSALDVSFNSRRPTARGDGSAWSGRGTNARAMARGEWRRGSIAVQVAPVLWWAENRQFPLQPTTGAPWSDGLRPITIDLPQRFGGDALARLDPGESFIEWEGRSLRARITTAGAQLGPAGEHSLVLQADGGGYPRMELATARALRTPIGDVSAQISWGRVAQSAWSPARRTGALLTAYVAGTWRPRGFETLELGMVRLTHVDWEGWRARDLLVPFGSAYQRAGAPERPDNQFASVHARLRVPAAGLEFFGEFGKNDRSRSVRDYVVEAEHGAAWLLGLQRSWRDSRERLWSAQATGIGGAISPVTGARFQSTFYDHFPLVQGHTLRGQLLGSPLLEREGGLEIRVDRYDPSGAIGVVFATRGLTNEYAAAVDPENLRQEWSVMLERSHRSSHRVWWARLGGLADLGYSTRTGDLYSVHAALGYSWR